MKSIFTEIAIQKVRNDPSVGNVIKVACDPLSTSSPKINEIISFSENIINTNSLAELDIEPGQAALALILLFQSGVTSKCSLYSQVKTKYHAPKLMIVCDLIEQKITGQKIPFGTAAYKVVGVGASKRAFFYRNLDYKHGSYDYLDSLFDDEFITKRSEVPRNIYKLKNLKNNQA